MSIEVFFGIAQGYFRSDEQRAARVGIAWANAIQKDKKRGAQENAPRLDNLPTEGWREASSGEG